MCQASKLEDQLHNSSSRHPLYEEIVYLILREYMRPVSGKH